MQTFTAEIRPRRPFNFELTVHKPAGWDWLTPYEIYEEGIVWSALSLSSGKLVGLKAFSKGSVSEPTVKFKVFAKGLVSRERQEVVDEVARLLAAGEDLSEFYAIARRDSILRETCKRLYGMRDTPFPNLFSGIILAITLQMAPVKRSRQMMHSLIRHFGRTISFDGKSVLVWPNPATIANVSTKELREKCKLGYRAENLKAVAETLVKAFPSLQDLAQMSPDEAKKKLMELRGIGEYSAEIVSPHRGFPIDIWSVKFFHKMLFGHNPRNPHEAFQRVREEAERRWGNWMGYAFVYVLNDLKHLSKKFRFSY